MTDGLCECGCGLRAPIAASNDATMGYVAGRPKRFVQGHNMRGRANPKVSDARRGKATTAGPDHYAWLRDLHQEPRGYLTPCLISGIKKRPDGYVRICTPSGARYQHRAAWEAERGTIPPGLEIDHLCYQRDCANTAHMELVTRRENTRRRRGQRTKNGPVLVTGAHGFIGTNMVAELAGNGYTVVAVDKGDGDLTDPAEAYRLIGDHEPATVIHFAAQVGRQFCEDNPTNAILSNVVATLNVARACAWIGCDMIHTSTSEVYGDRSTEVCHEIMPFTGVPTGVYALTKRQSEDVARAYGPRGLKILRPSMPYGPGAPPGRGRRALDNFLWQAHHGMPIQVHRGAARSWCWIQDVTRGIRLIMERGDPGPYNVGRDDVEVSMLELARMACDIAGAPHDLIVEVDAPPRQTVVKRLSTDRLRSLGWTPEVELAEGMAEVFQWVRRFDREGRLVSDAVAA